MLGNADLNNTTIHIPDSWRSGFGALKSNLTDAWQRWGRGENGKGSLFFFLS